MKTLSPTVLKDYAQWERVQRIYRRWKPLKREFRLLESRILRTTAKGIAKYQAMPFWESDAYKAACRNVDCQTLKLWSR